MKKKKSKTKRIKKEPVVVNEGRLYVNASFNNTLVTITDREGKVVGWTSSGRLGFKGTRKSTPYAATTTVEEGVELARKMGMRRMEVFIKGPGPGRDAVLKVLGAKKDIDVLAINDVTPIPHNGPRPPKRRRV